MLAIFLVSTIGTYAVDPYLDPTLSSLARARDLVSRMTLTEKVNQLGSKPSAITRLSVKAYNYWVEGLHGVARQGLATSFPQPYGMAATWDTTLVYRVATAISDEARVKSNVNGLGLTYWCPVVNMDRDPRWGREEENFGEDTYLAARLAVNYIKGMQGNDPKYLKTVATAKHFACNNVEQGRTSTSSNPDERSLREYFLPVFKACVQEGNVSSIMSAYNAVNSVPSPANRTLLENILRQEWGFKGFVVSDCDAVSDVAVNHKWVPTLSMASALSLKAGTDLNCGSTYQTYAAEAVSKGYLKESEIDSSLVRMFTARMRLGEFDAAASVPYTSIPASVLDGKENRELAYLMAQKSIVLLKNENSFLPLNKDSVRSIAIIGPSGKAVRLGDYSGSPLVSITPMQGIAAKLGINTFDGTIEAETATVLSGGPKSEACGEGGSEIGFIKTGTYIGYDSIKFGTNVDKVDLRIASNNTAGGTLQILIDNPSTGTVIATASIPYTAGWQVWKTVTADVSNLTGKHKLFIKFTGGSGYLFNLNWLRFYNNAVGATVPASFAANGKTISYAMGTSVNGAYVKADIDSAVNVAKRAQYVILVCGTDNATGGESADRSAIGLPGAQTQLIQAIYAANPKTALVLVNGFSLAVNWEDANLPAILTAWYGGQAQGAAIADVIFGDYNPAGRLASTWYKTLNDLPTKYDYNIRHNRTYMYYIGTPLYPFGYGLSYSRFSYANMNVSAPTISNGEKIEVSVEVTNTSNRDGEEVPQFYINTPSNKERPIKQLKGFDRIALKAGETRTVKFLLKYNELSYYDAVSRTYQVEAGAVNLYVGGSSQDIRLMKSITATAGIVGTTYRRDPYANTLAETFESKTASVIIRNSTAGVCIDSLLNNSNVVYKNMNFTKGAGLFKVRHSCQQNNATLTIVLDSLNGKVLGTVALTPTATSDLFVTDSCKLTNTDGIHDIYLIVKGSGQVAKLNSFTFTPGGSTSISEERMDNKIQFQVFPNPAKREFSIQYQLPKVSDVSINVFNPQGVLCKSIVRKNEIGRNRLMIDIAAEGMSSGMYIIQINSDDYHKSLLLEVTN